MLRRWQYPCPPELRAFDAKSAVTFDTVERILTDRVRQDCNSLLPSRGRDVNLSLDSPAGPEALFDLIPLPAYVFDETTTALLAANDAALKRYGYTRDEFLALSAHDLRPAEDRESFDHLLVAHRGDQIFRGTVRHLTKAGAVFDVEIVSHHVEYQGRGARFVVVDDPSERRRIQREAEERLHESHRQVRRIAARARARREEDRTRLARELHDQLGQSLAGLKMDVFWLRDRLGAATQVELAGKIESMLALLDETIDRIRRISADLRPPVLDRLGLVPALEWAAEEFARRSEIRVCVDSHVHDVSLDRGRSTAVFRIVQEALTNAATHAHAAAIDVLLEVRNGQLVVQVHDDGAGIPPAALTNGESLGLLGMHERASLLGGTATLAPGASGGTVVTLSVPLADRRRLPREDWA
jgi:PAS domain S-box-containing protein